MEDASTVQFGDWHTARARLRTLREEGGRRSWEVADLGDTLLREYAGKLGNEGTSLKNERYTARGFVFALI